MDGTEFGKLIVDIILAYWVGKAAWNKTQNSGKVTLVVIIALISPIIAWIVEACMKPAPKPVEEPKEKSQPAVNTQKTEIIVPEKNHSNVQSDEQEKMLVLLNKDEEKTEFELDIISLMSDDSTQSLDDICLEEYKKATELVDKNDSESLHKAYDIMGNLASQFEYIPAMMWLGDFAEFVKKDEEEALIWYKRSADKGDGNGARCYADLLMKTANYSEKSSEAMSYYSKAADSGIPEAAFAIGEFLRNSGELEHALDAYNRALDLGYEPAKIRIEQIKKNQEKETPQNYGTVPWRNEEGKIECDETRCPSGECIPECPIHRNTVALQMMKNGNYKAALTIYDKVLESDPDFPDAWSNAGACHGSLRDYEQAYQYFKKAYELSPRRTSLYGLALAANDSGRTEEAILYYETYKKEYDNALDATFLPMISKDKQELKTKTSAPVFCRFCGSRLNENAKFCHRCGKQIGR